MPAAGGVYYIRGPGVAEERTMDTTAALAGLAYALVMLAPLGYVVVTVARVRAARRWPAAAGQIVDSAVRRDTLPYDGRGASVVSRPRVTYEYTAAGRVYRADRYSYGGLLAAPAAEIVAR